MPFSQAFKLFNWFPMLTLPLFIYMGYVLAESGIAEDLYKMLHVWLGRFSGGLAIGTIVLMVIISAMNGLSVAGMAIGATIALPEMLRRGYDKVLITGVIQGGSSLGILVPPSVVMVLYGMIAREPVSALWLAGIVPGLLMASMFAVYIAVRCRLNPALAPTVSDEELNMPLGEKLKLLRAGIIPFLIFFAMTGLFVTGYTSLVESAAVGATAATLAALFKRRLSFYVIHETARKTLTVSCMFLWLILAALAFGAVFDGIGAVNAIEFPVHHTLGVGTLARDHHDATQLHSDGHVSGRHGHAGHRGAAVRPARRQPGIQPDLVRHSVHDDLPDRLHNAAVWLQSVPDALARTTRNQPDRHLPFDLALRADDGNDDRAGHDLPTTGAVAARNRSAITNHRKCSTRPNKET